MQVLGYNSNLHPAQRVGEIIEKLDQFAGPVREALAWDQLGIELHLGSAAIADLRDSENILMLRDCLERNHLSAHSFNAFPLSQFQTERVKDRAYDPDWRQPQRLKDSIDLIEIAMQLTAEDLITISTVPCSFKPWQYYKELLDESARNMGEWAAYAAHAYRNTNCVVQLAIEPEPWCFLENTQEIISFWQQHLLQVGMETCAEILGDTSAAQEAIRRHIGICFDTCHFSLAFDSLLMST